jgi:hypothetical protein
MKVENWNGHAIRFVERSGEWWAVAKDVAAALGYGDSDHLLDWLAMESMGYIPLPMFLKKDEYIKNEIYLSHIRIALTTNDRLIYITHWYGESDYIVIPNIAIELSILLEDEKRKEVFKELLVTHDNCICTEKPTEIIKKIYALFGIRPGELRTHISDSEHNRTEETSHKKGVYLIRADNGLTKIGCTGNLEKRLKSITTASPCKLTLIGFLRCRDFHEEERKLHCQFAGKRIQGEWFDLNEVDLMALNEQFHLGLSVSEAVYRKYCTLSAGKTA